LGLNILPLLPLLLLLLFALFPTQHSRFNKQSNLLKFCRTKSQKNFKLPPKWRMQTTRDVYALSFVLLFPSAQHHSTHTNSSFYYRRTHKLLSLHFISPL
jgi:hypothetical protein